MPPWCGSRWQRHGGVVLLDHIDLVPDLLVLVRQIIAVLHDAAAARAILGGGHLEGEDLIPTRTPCRALVVVPVRRESDPAAGHGHGLAHDQQLGDVVVVLAGLAEDEAVAEVADERSVNTLTSRPLTRWR